MSHLILKNGFARKPSSKKHFLAYFNDCLSKATEMSSIDEAISFTKEGEAALSIFSEKARINNNILSLILNCQERVDSLYQSLSGRIAEEDDILAKEKDAEKKKIEEQEIANVQRMNDELNSKNQSILDQLHTLLINFYNITDQKQFNAGIERMTELENALAKESFTDMQSKQYTNLTNDFSKVVSDIMANINRNKDVAYNVMAIDKFKDVFCYSKNLSKIKLDETTKQQILPLFQYETARLFPESMIYYNYVYSSIFSKLNDNDKYELTILSVNTPRVKE